MYRYEISRHDIKLVKKSIKILEDLKAPISKKITFGYTGSKSYLGVCEHKDNRFLVLFHPNFTNDYFKTTTIIHEILHTVPDENCYYDHRGEWAKWAKIVSNSSPYKIKTCGEWNELKNGCKNIPTNYVMRDTNTRKVYCPYCGRSYDIPSNGRDYWCPKCDKPLFKTPQNDELSKISVNERQNEILLRMSNLNIETAPKLLLYANKSNTEKIIINLMDKYPLDNDLKKIIKPYITTSVQRKLNILCKNGNYNKFMTSVSILIDYEILTNAKCSIEILFQNWKSES